MKHSFVIMKCLVFLAITVLTVSCAKKRDGKPRILVFSKTAGYHHESIAVGNQAIKKLGGEHNFDVDTTTNAEMFNEDSLKKYAAVVFLSTTGNVLDNFQEAAFERYIQAGGGYMGIHAAADTEYDWGWYCRLAGAYFLDHPGINDTFPNVQQGILKIADAKNDATKHFEQEWKHTDEFYSFKNISEDINVLMTVDEKSYRGGKNGDNHPMSWFHEFDGGRAFYTALGHTSESFAEEPYLKHILGGIEYAMGGNEELDFDQAKSQLPPDENRFSKTQLTQGEFFEPTEMTVLPNLDILVLQRRGEIMLYKSDTKKVKQVGFFDVYFKTSTPGVNAEEGMLGIAKDPDFAKNNFVFIYYSPADSSVNRLSRFTFQNDTISKSTEKVILEVKSQREICCHTGGSIAFGPDKLLYLSTGDNSTPFNEKDAKYVNNGFAPLNDLPGHKQYDARRSAGNTNDLRGKIMRIRVNQDGSYDIPEGNLFPKGTANTRPEIYVMGNRNPYRISIDQKNSNLYWGEVGPDAQADSLKTRGPRGYDEVNQARNAGFFGWPLFVGDNYPYHQYNYATGQSGPEFNKTKPVNNSKNNTGLTELPAVQPAFIWYPYAESPDFPQLGSGGRNAMAGPVYYTDMYPEETRLPDYYNGKLLIYDWMRGYIKAVSMKPNGDYDKMESFFGSLDANAMIDMEAGPDGRIYILEYGSGWFSKNADAGLARIDFNGGNRPPVLTALKVDKTSGALPFTVKATISANDQEKDKVSYIWDLGNGTKKETSEPQLSYTYTAAGDYQISVAAKDDKGAEATSNTVGVYAGNDAPVVSINLFGGNQSFFVAGKPVKYSVTVTDKNSNEKIDPANLFVSVDYIQGFDQAEAPAGHLQGQANIEGKNLVMTLDCKSCHKENGVSVGPSYLKVAQKYAKDPNANSYLTKKIITGGGGVWGEVAMPAHPALSQADASQIVSYIMSLGNSTPAKRSLPMAGSITPPANQKPGTVMVITASYTDKGGTNFKALTGYKSVSLKSSTVAITGQEKTLGFTPFKFNGADLLVFPTAPGWFTIDSVDLTAIRSANIAAGWQQAPKAGLTFEVHLDAPDGKLLGKGNLASVQNGQPGGIVSVPLSPVTDGKRHTLYFVYNGTEPLQAGVSMVEFKGN